ncbi:hypothetical protein [Wolbachia endosymbiont of Dirofilaria (Dirofilaria) immitis]|uniref:hypothetical protein n=1 Tax=Wolbachia endosymbiont of Dirofilaria (Dirofilaria) immitis TaxID=1812115 RepID=UPI00158A062C|nr:hypothetical protein [Wolbachia endosymbiont of Dirofilaria (Dirofilaria) immitis]QKX02384.1 hypothetical protein GOY12_02310 [Wolbachia endosymbiont of Dirofilaria (Dirofilaria) immitis]
MLRVKNELVVVEVVNYVGDKHHKMLEYTLEHNSKEDFSIRINLLIFHRGAIVMVDTAGKAVCATYKCIAL